MSNRPSKRPIPSERVRQARSAERQGRTWWLFGGLGLIVVVALVVALAVAGGGGPEGGSASPSGGTVVPAGDESFGAVTVEGESLVELPAAQPEGIPPDPAIGLVAPTVSGSSFDGSPLSITDDGRPKVISFMAHWCPHCREEVPRLQAWLDENGMPADVGLYTVATGTSPTRANYPPGDWLRSEGWSIPTLVDDEQSSAGRAFGLSGFPFFVVLDAEGRVVVRTSGQLSTESWEMLLDAARTGLAAEVPAPGAGASPAN